MPRVKEKLVGTQLLVPAELRDRARALAIVRNESVARIWREAVEKGGIDLVEANARGALDALDAVLATSSMPRTTALETILAKNWTAQDLTRADVRKHLGLPK